MTGITNVCQTHLQAEENVRVLGAGCSDNLSTWEDEVKGHDGVGSDAVGIRQP